MVFVLFFQVCKVTQCARQGCSNWRKMATSALMEHKKLYVNKILVFLVHLPTPLTLFELQPMLRFHLYSTNLK